MSTRLEALKKIQGEYLGERLRVKAEGIERARSFIYAHDSLSYTDFEYKVNRMFLDIEKPKQWTAVMELLLSVNTRAKGNDK